MTGRFKGKLVLVVEDEPLIAMVMEDMISDLGGECVVAASVAEAISKIAALRFDAAVLDLNLKGETSRQVGVELRAQGVPFAYATGYGDAATDTDGATVIAKPYTPEVLALALSRLLGV